MCRQSEEDVPGKPVTGPAESGSRGPGLTRRRALLAGAGAGIALAALDAVPAAASTGLHPGSAAARREVSFDEGWRFFRGDVSGAQAPGFDDSRWRELDVPHDWRIEDLPYATSDDGGASANPSAFAFNTNPSPDGNPPQVIGPFDANADPVPDNIVNYGGHWVAPGGRSQGYTVAGTGWYRKHFTVPDLLGGARGSGDGQRAELRFDGVYGRADVWLNGVHLGFHPYGYTSFAYDLTPHLNPGGENVLAVRVDNSGKTSRWYSGSGIYRHTWLTVTGPVRIPLWGTYVTTPVVDEGQSVAHVEVQVANFGAAAAASVRMTVLDPRGRRVVTQTTPAQTVNTGATQTYAADLVITGAALWSPEDPSLYQVGAEVLLDGEVADDVRTTFGIRSLEWNGMDGFLLNGKQVKLLAGCIHHDHGPLGAMALDRSEERVIETLKAAGFNAIRASHNPRAPYMLEVCDRLGMLVWDEFSDVWDVGKLPDDYSNYFPQYWQQDLTSMILRDRNHASVIIWSLGNEIPSDPNNYGPRLKALVQSLDNTRAITVGGTPGSESYEDVLDIHYGNWDSQQYGTDSGDSVFSTHASDPAKAVTQSESFAATIYDDTELAADNPWFAGNFVWTAWDYIGETGISAPAFGANYADAATYQLGATFGAVPYPWYSSFSGDFDLIGQRKPQNHWRAVVYGRSNVEMMVERPAPPGTEEIALLFGYYDELESWTWDVPQGQSMTVHVYTSGDNVTLLLNGTQIAATSLTDADRMIATLSVPYAPGELTAIATRNGTEIGRKTLTTTGAPAALRLSSDVGSLTTARDDLAHVLVEVVDAHGRRVPDAVVKVGFTVNGAGRLAGVGNGNPHNADSFQRPRRWTWHGQALTILRPAKTPGRLTLTATAQGLKSASMTLPVSAANTAPHSSAVPGKPRVAASLAGPGLALGLGAALLKRRVRRARSTLADE
jgi:beta-galactosidase